MQLPLQVTFRNLPQSDAIESAVREKMSKLEQFFDHVMSCRIVIEAPHQHQKKGRLYHVRIDMTVPGDELVVSRSNKINHAHEDIYVVIRDAFDAARRQLQAYIKRRRGQTKHHQIPDHGKVISLEPQQDYGVIGTQDGREVYFHRNSVLGKDFEQLEVGTEVRITGEEGEKGPQASTVHVVGKHHIVS